MRFGLWLPRPGSPDELDRVVEFVAQAERRGFRSLWTGDHAVAFPAPDSYYPYGSGGRWDLGAEEVWLEPFAFLAYLAAHTTRIRLGTGVVLVPQRNPVYTAKSVGTLDFLSRGRIDFGIGLGWSREEFDALGVPWEGRGARCREYVEVMRTLWCDEVASHSGPLYELPPCSQRPMPLQAPHPPLWFGGEGDAALRRVADLGDGWFGWPGPRDAAERVGHLRALLAQRGRDPGSVQVAVGCPWPAPDGATDLDAIDAYAEAGVDQLLVAWPGEAARVDAVEALDAMVQFVGDRMEA
jgi:probable F420-dependent oxidoreductase